MCSQNILFQIIFPDSKIVQEFNCGKTKCCYLLCHGVALHVKEILLSTVSVVQFFVWLESFNYISKKSQIDGYICYWNDNRNEVSSLYFNSILRKASAQDILNGFNICMSAAQQNDTSFIWWAQWKLGFSQIIRWKEEWW